MSAPTPSEAVRVAVQEALDLSKFAAAPFFGSQVRQRDDDGEVSYIWATTPEWWAGLQELIERVQPMLQDALAALSLHVAPDTDTGASATPTALSAPALRASAPIAGAGGQSDHWIPVERMLPECAVRVLVYEERDGTVCLDRLVADEQGEPDYWRDLGYGPHTFVTHWMPLPASPEAQAIVTREGQDPQGLGGEAIERGPAGMRPEDAHTVTMHIEGPCEAMEQAMDSLRHQLRGWQIVSEAVHGSTGRSEVIAVLTDQTRRFNAYPAPSPHTEPVAWRVRSFEWQQWRYCDGADEPYRDDPDYQKQPVYASPTTPTEGPAQPNGHLREAALRVLSEARISEDRSRFRDDVELLAKFTLGTEGPAQAPDERDSPIAAMVGVWDGKRYVYTRDAIPGGEPPEVRLNDDKTLDEVVGTGAFHLEQMDTNHWWMCFESGGRVVYLHMHARGKITATFEESTLEPAARAKDRYPAGRRPEGASLPKAIEPGPKDAPKSKSAGTLTDPEGAS